MTPEAFRAPFTAAGGWGTYAQMRSAGKQAHSLEIKHGRTFVKTLALELPPGATAKRAAARLGGKAVGVRLAQKGTRVEAVFDQKLELKLNQKLDVELILGPV
jgi:hypothetical protein